MVDGFNVYHSLIEASRDLGGQSTKWLDLRGFLSSYLYLIGGNARLERIHYFTALADHLDVKRPGVTTRHREYIECLRATNVSVELGRFKQKKVYCKSCKTNNIHWEEKETDVAISVGLLEVLSNDSADAVVIVSGDTDLAPGVRSASRMFPTKRVLFAFPYKRKNAELARLVPVSFRISKEQYARYQFPDPYLLLSGRSIPKPSHW